MRRPASPRRKCCKCPWGVGDGGSQLRLLRLLPVLLDAGSAQSSQTMLVDRLLPGEELLYRQRITGAGLLEAEEAAAHRGDHLRLAADDPTLGIAWRKVG